MNWQTWFVFDLGNVVVKLAYERALHAICSESEADRDRLVEIMEWAGGYRDLEKGMASFSDFHEFLREKIRFRGDERRLREIWEDFFDGPVDGIEEVLERVRARYRVAFLSNTNEVHAEVIPRLYPFLFRKDDRFIFSYRHLCVKPDPLLFQRALELLGALPSQVIFTDDLMANVSAARELGIRAFHFKGPEELLRELADEDLL